MAVKSVSLTELKQNLGDIVNRAAYGGERITLLSRGKEHAALISIDDLRRLEQNDDLDAIEARRQRRLEALEHARALRAEIEGKGQRTDSVKVLAEIREERLNELTSLR